MSGYFEGWYFKQETEKEKIALIPAVHREDGTLTKASLQVITKEESFVMEYPFTAMNFQRNPLTIQLGNNMFSKSGMTLNECGTACHLTGELKFQKMIEPQKDIMGPFAKIPHMQCYHSLFSLKHSVTGKLELNGKEYEFLNGLGYIEGDRGSSFPKEYLWTQSFFGNDTPWCSGSLMLAVADIPVPWGSFTGIIGYVLWNGKEYRFTTYYGAKVKQRNNREIIVEQGSYRFHVTLLEEDSKTLQAPIKGGMKRLIKESLQATARYRLYHHEHLLLDIHTNKASFEWMYS